MQSVFALLLRLILFFGGVLFALSLLLAGVLLVLLWALRSVWAKLTGKAVAPFVMRVDPGTGFSRVFRSGAGAPPPAGAAPAHSGTRGRLADVEDVEVKPPRD